MIDRKHQVPEVVSGYEVFEGLISFIRPSSRAINLIKNPRMWNTTGYTSLGNTDLTCTHTDQYRGIFSLYCSGSTGSYNGAKYEVSMLSGQKYKFSADFKTTANQPLYIFLDTTGSQTPDTAGVLVEKKATGDWQRLNWEFDAPSSGNMSVCIATDNTSSFYTDGWMLIQSDDTSGEPELYFDGETRSFTLEDDFGWLGIKDQSLSLRRSGSGASGREVFLTDIGFQVRGIAGLGMNPVNNVAVGLNRGGAYYQNSVPSIRNISIVGSIMAQSHTEYMGIHRELIDLFKSDRTPNKQPLLMRIYSYDTGGNMLVPALEMRVVYQSGLQGKFVSDYGEIISLDFVEYDQYIAEDKDSSSEFVIQPTRASGIVALRYEGDFDNLEGGPTPNNENTRVYAILTSNEGDVYVGGDIEPCNHASYFDGATWNNVSTGMANPVFSIVEWENYIVFGGENGELRAFNKTTKSFNYPIITPYGTIYSMVTYGNKILMGGAFTSPFNYIMWYDPVNQSFTEFASGYPNGIVRKILVSKDQTKVFIAGDFTMIDFAPYKRIAYIEVGEDWHEMGSGFGQAGADVSVYDIVESGDGTIYACGNFNYIQGGDVAAKHIARYSWQKSEWETLNGQTAWENYATHLSDVSCMTVTTDNVLYFAGHTSTNITRSLVFKYVGDSFICPTHILVSGETKPIGYGSLAPTPDGGVYIGRG